MERLSAYLRSLSPAEQHAFAKRCSTSVGYLRKAISVGHRLGCDLVVAIERESRGIVRCEDLRPDTDWSYVRGTARRSRSNSERAAT